MAKTHIHRNVEGDQAGFTNASGEFMPAMVLAQDGSDSPIGVTSGGMNVYVVNQAAGGGGTADQQYAEGTVAASVTGTAIMWRKAGNAMVPVSTNDPLPVTVGNFPATQPVSGTVAVSNLPATQPVSGTVSVSNFPATQPVSGTFWQATQPVSAASLPLPAGAAQEHTTAASPHAVRLTDGTAFFKPTTPADTQPVSGTVGVNNFPATQAVSGTVTANQGAAGATAWKVDGSAVTQPVSGPITDTQLRATPVPVSGTVTSGRTSLPVAGVTGDTGTKTASFVGATQTNDNALGAYIIVVLGTVSGTTPTLACQLQWSPDNGTTWLALGAVLPNLTASSQTGVIAVYPAAVTATLGGTASVATNAALPRTWRINYTIGGTIPSFAITAVRVQYLF